MKRFLKIGVPIAILLVGIMYINFSVYPFQSQEPNFADVERVFNKMQFPSEWKEIRSSENRGIAGRTCPIESESQCFHIGKQFEVPVGTSTEEVRSLAKMTGCPVVAFNEQTPEGSYPYTNFSCSIDALEITGGIKKNSDQHWEVSLYVNS